MAYLDLTEEEQEIIERMRTLNDSSKQEAILASESSFKEWIKKTLPSVWKKILEIGQEVAIRLLVEALNRALGFQ